MGKRSDSRARKRKYIGAETCCAFLSAVRSGVAVREAAAGTGFTLGGFYSARQRNPLVRLAWAQAMELSAGDERDRRAAARAGEVEGEKAAIAANNKRRVQLRRRRRVEFTPRRQEIFLAHFAQTADVRAAAEAAGVNESTVYRRRRSDPAFAADFQQALDHAFVRLEAEALRQRLEAQQRLKESMAAGELPPEAAPEFERVLKLLQRWDRKSGQPGMRGPAPGRMKSWTFEQAIEALDKKLRAVDIPILGEESADRAGEDDLPEAAE